MNGTGSEMRRPTLLLIDAPGGPRPSLFGPRLSLLADLEFICLRPKTATDARSVAIAEYGEVTEVESPLDLVGAALDVANRRPIDGVLAFNEAVVYYAAVVAEALGLPHNSVRAATLMREKDLQRMALDEAGLTVPVWACIDSEADVPIAAAEVGFPAVLKPVIGMASVETRMIWSLHELEQAYNDAVPAYLRDPRLSVNAPRFVLEAMLHGSRWHDDDLFGDYVSVEAMVWHGEVRILTVTDKLPLAHEFREQGDVMPSTLSTQLQDEIKKVATAAVLALKGNHGMTHTEIKLTPEGPVVIEVNGRVGGGVTELAQLAFGYDIISDLGRMALGERPRLPEAAERCAGFLHPQGPARALRIERIEGAGQIAAEDSVSRFSIIHDVGAEPDWREGTTANLYHLQFSTPSPERTVEFMKKSLRTLVFEFEYLD